MAQYEWIPLYKEIAQKLLQFYGDRRPLVQLVNDIFAEAGLNMPKLEQNSQLVDIDPFTVFGLFNKSSMREDKRRKILAALLQKLEISADLPANFDGIPVLNNQNATFYYFLPGRGKDDIEDLWIFYTGAMRYAVEKSERSKSCVAKSFDVVVNKKGNGNSKITMGLYWIAPDVYLNLDSRNEWYLYESGKMPQELVAVLPKIDGKMSAEQYFEIADKVQSYLESGKCPQHNFAELSTEAWRYSQQVNEEKKTAGDAPLQAVMEPTAMPDENVDTVHYWLYAPGNGADKWEEFYQKGIMAIGWGEIGDLKQFASKEAMKERMKAVYSQNLSYRNAAHATWQFANEMKPGDIVFVKKGRNQIIGRGVVESAYRFDASRTDTYNNIRDVKWTHHGEWQHPGQAVLKTLTDVTSYTEYVEKLNALFADDLNDEPEEVEKTYPPYGEDDFLQNVFMQQEDYEKLVDILKIKKNIILQGAPGVGKTYAAKRLAYSIMGEKDVERVMMVQFHQSYSYEDFIMGYRPTATGFELKKGAFYNFCKKAEIDTDRDYFFIIDEINRGNLSKIFGELFMLIENDKRGIPLQLLYADEKFSVPRNVYLIGMMNTADRSLAMLDYALRRRFAFVDLKPGFETEGFRAYQEELQSDAFDRLIACVLRLNAAIAADESLGEGFCIGHSYFCNRTKETTDAEHLNAIVEYELIPLLREYWFDEPEKVRDWAGKLRSAIR